MRMRRVRWLSLFGALLIAGLRISDCPAQDALQAAATWHDRASIVLQTVAQSADIPNELLPTALAQDKAGFLWGGGETGLVRWDGYHFRNYTPDPSKPGGLRDYLVFALHADEQGRLWVGTSSGGLAYHDAATDRFVTVPLGADRAGARTVLSIQDDHAGGVWVATNGGLFHVSAEARVIEALRHDPSDPMSLPRDKVQAVLCDRQGFLWAGSRDGLVRDGGGRDHRFRRISLASRGAEPEEVTQLMQDGIGRIWVATRHRGAYVIDADGQARHIAVPGRADEEDIDGEVMSMSEVLPGRIWLATFGHGILQVDGPDLQLRKIMHEDAVPNSLDSNAIYALRQDQSGLIWVSTTRGLSHFDPHAAGFLPIFGQPAKTDSVSASDVSAMLAFPDGRLWLASQIEGVDQYDAAGHRGLTLPVKRVFGMEQGPGDRVFFATRGGLYMAPLGGAAQSGQLVSRLAIPGRPMDAGIFAVCSIGDVLWIGGTDDGAWALHVASDSTVTVLRHLDVPNLSSGAVHTMAVGPGGTLVLGTEGGADLVDPSTDRIEHIRADPADPRSLSAPHVQSLAYDRAGRLWIGTDNGGLDVMVGRDAAGRPRLRRFGLSEGLPNLDINSMLPDRRGHIWLSTDAGLVVIDPDDFAVRAFGVADGVAVSGYWSNSAAATGWGDLLFGGLGGMTLVQPDIVADWRYMPPVAVTEVRIGGRTVQPAPGEREGAADTLWAVIPPGRNSMAVEFAALDYSAPAFNRYRYRLEGFDTDWIETDALHRTATYTNLSPGNYTLLVRGSNRTGTWSPMMAALQIRVLPAWFQTWWCHLVELLAAFGVLTGAVQGRTVLLRARQRELQHLVEQRTAELSARTAELSRSEERLQHMAYFDVLTALPNRRAFNDVLTNAMEVLEEFALVLIDLDGFKQVNDALGHDAGDDVLVLAADVLREAVRDGDFVARLGGDEFAILLRRLTDKGHANMVCQRIVTAMSAPIKVKDSAVRIGASLGIAMCPADGRDAETLYKHVDLAMYDAKHAGRGVWRWYQAAQLRLTDSL